MLTLLILDGWGISFVREGNAIMAAHTPTIDSYARIYPSAAIQAAGIEVGLPWGSPGNSETGHRNMGAGQVQYQTLLQIDNDINEGGFYENEVFLNAISHAKENSSSLHLMGLMSAGGVHSHMQHLFTLLELCARKGMRENVYIHMFTDGRDTLPQSALTYLQSLEEAMGRHGVGKIASVCGRFYAMDRNNNWDRTESVYNMLVGGKHTLGAPSARAGISQAYAKKVYDEMIPPIAITRGGEPIGTISDNDAVIFFNFRPDRSRQLTRAFAAPDTTGFAPTKLKNVYFATMAQFDIDLPVPAAYISTAAEFPLARVLSDAGLTQLHIAETEKYAHVTYYFNVGRQEPFPNEDHVMIPSSNVRNFADEPRMKAKEITDRVVKEMKNNTYDFYVVNLANPDMIGHTGSYDATVEACAFVDVCTRRLEEAALANGGSLLITADHGNAEELTNPGTGDREKDHTTNPVPMFYVASDVRRRTPKSEQAIIDIFSSPIGVLADIAPTCLDIMGIEKPASMTGISLLGSLR